MTFTQELQIKYWNEFNDYLKTNKSSLKSKQKVLSQQWHTIALGKGWVHIEVIANKNENRVELYLKGPTAKRRYSLLEKNHRSESEAKFGDAIKWNEMPQNIISKIVFERPANIETEKEWTSQFKWLKENADAMHDFFAPKLDELKHV